jgi:FixJ family two-component response regulator
MCSGLVHWESRKIMTKPTVAVVDDSEIMRDAMVHLLCSAGFAVESYLSAEEFLTAADVSQANCLVVDIELGDITGIELVRELRDLGYSIPVIFMTGSPDDTFRRAACALECSAFFAKPFPAQDMLAAIERASARQPQLGKYA